MAIVALVLPSLLVPSAKAAEASVLGESVTETCESHGVTYTCRETRSIQERLAVPYEGGIDNATLWDVRNGTNAPLSPLVPSGPGHVDLNAMMETPIRVVVANNTTSVTPRVVSGVYIGGGVPYTDPVIPALQFSVRLNPAVFLNGVSEWAYRSPLVLGLSDRHIVNFFDSSGRLVGIGDNVGPTRLGAVREAHSDSYRQDYIMDTALFSGQNYTVREYVVSPGTPPTAVNHVDVAMGYGEDIDGNGAGFRVFPGTPQEQVAEDSDPAFWIRGLYGISAGGAYVIEGATNSTHQFKFLTNYTTYGSPSADHFSMSLPLRATSPVNLTIIWNLQNASAPGVVLASGTLTAFNVTGDVQEQVGIGTTVPAGDRIYEFLLLFDMRPGSYIRFPADFLAAHPNGVYAQVGASVQSRATFFSPWLGIGAFTTGDSSMLSLSQRSLQALIGVGELLGAAAIFALGVYVVAQTGGIAIPIGVAVFSFGSAVLVRDAIARFHIAATGHGEPFIDWGTLSPATPDAAKELERLFELLAAVAACAGIVYAPSIPLKVASGLACGLLVTDAFGNATLPGLVVQILKDILKDVELVGQLIHQLLSVAVPAILVIAGLILLLMFLPVLLGAVKWLLLIQVIGIVAGVKGKGLEWRPLRAAYRWYIPGWCEFIETRWFKTDVRKPGSQMFLE